MLVLSLLYNFSNKDVGNNLVNDLKINIPTPSKKPVMFNSFFR